MLLVAGRGGVHGEPTSPKGGQDTLRGRFGLRGTGHGETSKSFKDVLSFLDGAMAGPLAMISLDGPPCPLCSPSEMRSRESTWTGPDAGVLDDKRRANGPKVMSSRRQSS